MAKFKGQPVKAHSWAYVSKQNYGGPPVKDIIAAEKLTKPKWVTVRSSNLYRVSYSQKDRLLRIIFVNKKNVVYNYKDVPGTIYLSLINAVSHGEYFSQKIKNVFGFYVTTV